MSAHYKVVYNSTPPGFSFLLDTGEAYAPNHLGFLPDEEVELVEVEFDELSSQADWQSEEVFKVAVTDENAQLIEKILHRGENE